MTATSYHSRVCSHPNTDLVVSLNLPIITHRSINPAVDLGQIEGAFVFGMGLMLSEHMEHDRSSGAAHV
jgi:hypothetical protein